LKTARDAIKGKGRLHQENRTETEEGKRVRVRDGIQDPFKEFN
jgi:hypothetical protein